jgi:phage terminase large subunit-like protein
VGLRGPSARPVSLPKFGEIPASSEPHPWEAPGLSRAERVIRFVEALPCTSGQWQGTKFRLRPWQKKQLRKIYRTDKNGRRVVRTVCWSMGRGNGKTGLAAVLALCHLAGPEAEARGEIYAAANDRFQAGRIFGEVAAIIERTPWLADRVSIRRHSKELEDIGKTGSFFAALSADVPSKHGLAPTFIVVDELGQSPSRDLLDALETSLGKRRDPMLWIISTQAARDEMPMSQIIDYGLRVQRGEIVDPSFHLVLNTAPKDADPWSPRTWKRANPGLGDILSREHVERLAHKAQRMPSAEASFRNLVLNQRVDATAQFITASVWALGNAPVAVDRLKGRPCWAGLDLGATRDLTALVLVFADDGASGGSGAQPPEGIFSYDVLPFFWLPGDDLRDREDADRVPYVRWREEGHLLTVPGKTMDPAAVARKLAELHGQYDIKALAFDRWRIEDLKRELDAIGCDVPLQPFGQGYRDMAPAVDALEKLAVDGNLRHGANPLLTWCISNAKTTADPAGNRKLDKSKGKDAGARIDGAVALAMALGVATRHVAEEPWEPMVEVV